MASFNAVEAIIDAFPWLADLGPEIYDLIVSLLLDDAPSEVILSEIRQTDAYADRFRGIDARKTAGFNAISEFEYIQIEDAYRKLLTDFNLADIFIPDEDSFRNFVGERIARDISAAELSRRLDRGYAAVADSGIFVKEAFQQFYGFEPTDAQIALYFLDPTRGLEEIEAAAATSLIGGQALRYGLNITRIRADLLRQGGVSTEFASQGFADIAREQPQLESLAKIHSFSPLSQIDLEGFFFHEDPEIAKRRSRIFRTALGEFQGGSVAQTTRAGGLIQLLDTRPGI